MKTRLGRHPFKDERVVQTAPALSRRVSKEWQSRPYLFTGRALTADTLISNTKHHLHHLRLFGRHLSGGIVHGLELTHYTQAYTDETNAQQSEQWLRLTAGIGITSGGDDVSVPEAAEINLAHVFQPDGESSPRGAGVFVLQPLEVIDEIAPDEDSQCQWDKERDPFDDEQIIDGSRIVFFPWPEDILGPVPPVQNQRFRNRLAYRIFEYELRHYSGQFHISGEHFCLTEEALKGIHRALRKGDEIDFMLKRLTRLRTRMSISRSSFEDALKKTIGEVRTKKFQSMMDDVLHVLKRDEALIIPGADDQLKTFMTQLAGLKDQEFNSEERVLEALKQAIGEEQTRAHESLITEHAALDKYYDEPLPWEKLGVPLGLGYIVDDGRVRFIDQSAVVRQGGAPMSIDPLMKHNGTPFLWEARIQQFIEHLYAIRQAADDLPPAESYFEILPPVGVLPKQALNLDDMGTPFFPSQFVINAVPIPEEQVEVAMNASAGLEPIDLYLPEKIKLLVPVPQAVYEPDLLKKEIPDPIFLETLRKLIHQIRICLAGRVSLRNMAPKVVHAIDVAQVPSFPEDDDPIPDEGKFRAPASGGEEIPAFDERAVSAIRELYGWIKTHARYVSNTDIALLKVSKTMPPEYHQDFKGLEHFNRGLQKKIDHTEDLLGVGYVKTETDMYRLRQLLLGNIKASRLATSPAMGKIVGGEAAIPDIEDVERYFSTAVSTDTDTFRSPRDTISGIRPRPSPSGIRPGPSSILGTFKRPLLKPLKKGLTREKPMVERIYESPAMEVKSSTVTTKSSVFTSLADVPLDIDEDITLVGSDQAIVDETEFKAIIDSLGGEQDPAAKVFNSRKRSSSDNKVMVFSTVSLTDEEKKKVTDSGKQAALEKALANQKGKNRVSFKKVNLGAYIGEGLFDPDPTDGDEANYFSAGVTALEHGLEAMRAIDRKLDDYKKALKQCNKVLAELRINAKRWNDTLLGVDDKLTALRHDALVTRSLYDEERTRIGDINTQRKAILESYVSTLVFVRPRLVDPRLDVTSVKLYGEYVSPVPACLAEDFEAADELRDMLDVFREVPINWLNDAKPLVRLVNQPAQIVGIFQHAVNRTYQPIHGVDHVPQAAYPVYNQSEFGNTVNSILYAHQEYNQTFFEEKARIDFSQFSTKTWAELVQQAENQLSLADLIEAGKGHSKLARRATMVMENIEDVAVCLYHRCNDLEPAIKLQWANTVSVYDKPVDLRHLEILQAWDKIEFVFRGDLQNMVDWLFSQVDTGIAQARQTMNDLVRVCILLASHAPVSTIIRGYVDEPSTGKIGDFIDIVVSKGRVKVGMVATVFSEKTVTAQGIVEDISDKAARIKVTRAEGGKQVFNIDTGAQVKFFASTVGRTMFLAGERPWQATAASIA